MDSKIIGILKILFVVAIGTLIYLYSRSLQGQEGWFIIPIVYIVLPIYIIMGGGILIWGLMDLFDKKDNTDKKIVDKTYDGIISIFFKIFGFFSITILAFPVISSYILSSLGMNRGGEIGLITIFLLILAILIYVLGNIQRFWKIRPFIIFIQSAIIFYILNR